MEDLTGQVFGRLTVLSLATPSPSGRVRWLCRCECGNEKIILAHSLKNGDSRSCGCLHQELMEAKVENLVGKRVGRLVVIDQRRERRNVKCLCQCDCGKTKWIPYRGIREGRTHSCGCLSKDIAKKHATKHGYCGEPLYNVHRTMKQRCYNPRDRSYKWYGAKGIHLCKEWLSYPAFREWALSHGYKPGLTIERINVFGNYEPDNCCFITKAEQAKNRTTSLCNRGKSPHTQM